MTNPLEGFTAAIEVFRRIDPTFSGPVLATFLQVATNPGLSVQEVADRDVVVDPFDGPFGRTFTFTDPNGYQVTLHDRA